MADELKASCMFLKMPLKHKFFPTTTARASHCLHFVHHPTPFLENLGSLSALSSTNASQGELLHWNKIPIDQSLSHPPPFLLSILRELVSWFHSSRSFSMARL